MSEGENSAVLARALGLADADAAEIEALRPFFDLRVIGKNDAPFEAGEPVSAASIILSGRLVAQTAGHGTVEFGRGDWLGAREMPTREPAAITPRALRETVLMQLQWQDFANAMAASPALARKLMGTFGRDAAPVGDAVPVPSRLVVCGVGGDGAPDTAMVDALAAAFDPLAHVRVLRPESFGAGLPGGISFAAPETRHEFQEQEHEFDLTLIPLSPSADEAALSAIEEADEILFVARGGDGVRVASSPLLTHALRTRGAQACRAVLAEDAVASHAAFAACRSIHRLSAVRAEVDCERLARLILGADLSVAAVSSGAHAAAIWGAMRAISGSGVCVGALGAGGSAPLASAFFADGGDTKTGHPERLFEGLATTFTALRRAARPDHGLYEARGVDEVLVAGLPDLDMAEYGTPFLGVSADLSASGAAFVHRSGKLRAVVRTGLTPPGLLPPVINEDGRILVSGAHHGLALIAALKRLTPSPVLFIETQSAPLGPTAASYRDLSATGFRLPGLGGGARNDRRLGLETLLAETANAHRTSPGAIPGVTRWLIPMPEGIGPLDWGAWRLLHDMGHEWASARLHDVPPAALAGQPTPRTDEAA